jgi:(p)ppGpp synthase/HD superfamily hydrolase
VDADGTTPDWLRGSPVLLRAHALAREAHRGQSGKDGRSPYIGHPLAVAERLAADGLDEQTVTAAILHDVVERSELGIDEVVARFGVEVGELVSALTDDDTIDSFHTRKREHRDRVAAAGPRAGAIYAADKLANLRELERLYAKLGEAASGRLPVSIDTRVAIWRDDLAMLEALAPELAVVRELREELGRFEEQRPGARPHADVA